MPFLLALSGVVAVIFILKKKPTGGVASSKADFFARLRPAALAVERETGIKADFGMVQAAHESGYGGSQLTRDANNLFGFTDGGWKAAGKPVFEILTSEFLGGKWVKVPRHFRRYSSWEESYRDWARLMQLPRYAAALAAARAGNFPAFAAALKSAGYATDPTYDSKLVAAYRAYEGSIV